MAYRNVALPFSTFGDIADAGWSVELYCPACYRRVPLAITETLRLRRAFHNRFRCSHQHYSGRRCNSLGHLSIRSPHPIAPDSPVAWCQLFCGNLATPWEILHVRPGVAPFPAMKGDDRFRCPGCRGIVGRTWHDGNVPGKEGYRSVGGGRPSF